MSLAMTEAEQKQIDSQVEQMMDWAKTRKAEAEQLAMDAARLMSCTADRIDTLKNQGFFKRCWSRFTGEAGAMERANTGDLIQMQKMGYRYVNMLQEQQLLMAHSMLSLKNNLLSLAVKEEETRHLVELMAQNTLERFEKLESRVDQLEISTKLHGWLLVLEDCDYEEKYPTEFMRLFRVINDFYGIKNDNWVYRDLQFMRTALRTVQINPKKKLSLNAFIDGLTDEIQSEHVGFEKYGEAISLYKPDSVQNYSSFVLENISSPVFVSMHGLKKQYVEKLEVVEELQDEMKISASEALKRLLKGSISKLNVNLDYEFPLAETAIEILGCLRLADKLALTRDNKINETEQGSLNKESSTVPILNSPEESKDIIIPSDNSLDQSLNLKNIQFSEWKDIASPEGKVLHIQYSHDRYWGAFRKKGYGSRIDGSRIVSRICICSSFDIKDWEYHFDFQVENIFMESPINIVYNGAELLCSCGSYLYVSSDLKSFTFIDPFKRPGFDFKSKQIKNISWIGKKWFLSCTYDQPISYIEKGFFSDSKKSRDCTFGLVFNGESSTDLINCVYYQSSFPRGFLTYKDKILIDKHGIYAAKIYEYNKHGSYDSNPKLIVSKDAGKSWDIVDTTFNPLNLITIKDELYFNSQQDNKTFLVKIDIDKSNAFVVKESDSSFNIDYSDLIYYNNIFLYYNKYRDDEPLFISTDTINWIKTEQFGTNSLSSDHRERDYSYGDGKILRWDKRLHIKYKELI